MSDGEKNVRRRLARPERFELPTYSSGGCRSIQLSYGRAPNLLSLQPPTRRFKPAPLQCAPLQCARL